MLRISYKVLFISIICLLAFAWRLDWSGRGSLVIIILFGSHLFLALRFGVIDTNLSTFNKNESPVSFWATFVFQSLFFAMLVSIFVTDLSRPIEKKTRLPVGTFLNNAEDNTIQSINGIIKTSIEFINKSGQPIKVYWLDYEGKRKLYAQLKAEDSYIQQTYVTHPWLITDADDNAWDVYFPEAQPRIVEIAAPQKK